MYRPCRIEVRRSAGTYHAWIIHRDDGINQDGNADLWRGFDLEDGPYTGLTHRRAWRKAYRAAGRLYDVPDLSEAQQRAGGTDGPHTASP